MGVVLDLIIVDDDPIIADVLKKMLNNYELEIKVFQNALEAQEEIIKTRPRLVILDYLMPDLNGDQLIVKLSEACLFQDVSIFLLTGSQIDSTQEIKLRTLGFEQIIYKPLKKKELIQKIETVITDLPKREKVA